MPEKSYNCAICGRPLKDPQSIAYGIGPVCLGRRRGAHLRRRRRRDWSDRWIDTPFTKGMHLFRGDDGTAYTNIPHIVSDREVSFDFGPEATSEKRLELSLNVCEAWLRRIGYNGKKGKTRAGDPVFLHAYRLRGPFNEHVLDSSDSAGIFVRADWLEHWFRSQINPKHKQKSL